MNTPKKASSCFTVAGDSAGEGGETAGGDPMAQEIHLGNGEGALLEVDDQAGRLQPPKHLFH
ncbi:MAG: hypothetical protein ACK56I_15205, partial [bacterium]